MTSIQRRDTFATGHLQVDLRGRAVRGAAVTLGGQALRFGFQAETDFETGLRRTIEWYVRRRR